MKKSMLKRLTAALLAASVVAAMPLSASAAWKKTGDIWQWTENGQNATGWRWIGGAWYHFNASGDMTKGWLQENGTWYYLKGTGAMAQGWNLVNGKWYCMNANGSMRTGWVQTKGIWYFLAPNGDMQTGVIQVNGKTYCLDDSGAMKTGKVEIDGKTYNFGDDGAATGTAPKADKAFSTTSGSAVDVPVTTPSKPSYSGGGGSTGGNEGPVTPTKQNIRKTVAELNAFSAEEKNTGYGVVTILYNNEVADLSWLQAENVVIEPTEAPAPLNLRSARTATGITFGAGVSVIEVKAAVTINSAAPLEEITISNAVDITINAPVTTVNANAATTVTANGSVGSVKANAATTVAGDGAVELVIAKAPVTVDSGAAVEKVKIPAGTADVKVTATGSISEIVAEAPVTVAGEGTDKVTAKNNVTLDTGAKVESVVVPADNTEKVTVSGGTVANMEVGGEVEVTGGAKVTTVTVTDTDAKIEASGSGTEITKAQALEGVTTDENTITSTDSATVPSSPVTVVAVPPVAGDDFTVIDASADSPLKGSLTPITGEGAKTLQYTTDLKGDSWTDLNGKTELDPNTYYVRTKEKAATDTTGKVEASKAVEVVVKSFTGFSTAADTKDKYYEESKPVTSKWVTAPDGKNYLIGSDSKKTVNSWVASKANDSEKVWLGADGVSQGSFGLYTVSGGVDELIGTTADLQYSVDNGNNWNPCDPDLTKIPGLKDSVGIQVRVSPRITDDEKSASSVRTVLVTHKDESGVVTPAVVKSADELNAAIAANAPNIKLGDSITIANDAARIYFDQAGVSYTLDLNGKTLENTEAKSAGPSTIYVTNGSSLTIKDSGTGGKISGKNNVAVTVEGDRIVGEKRTSIESTVTILGGEIVAQESAILVWGEGATLIVSDGNIHSIDNAAIAGNGTKNSSIDNGGTHITINGGEITGYTTSTANYRNCGLYHPQAGALLVTDGTIKGNNGAGIVMRSGSLTMTGGTVEGNGTGGDSFKVGDALPTYCSGIEIGYGVNYPGGMGDINISGGTIKATGANCESFRIVGEKQAGDDSTITIAYDKVTFSPAYPKKDNSSDAEETSAPVPEEDTAAPETTPTPPVEEDGTGEPTGTPTAEAE